jgi:hypothetical protein
MTTYKGEDAGWEEPAPRRQGTSHDGTARPAPGIVREPVDYGASAVRRITRRRRRAGTGAASRWSARSPRPS